MVSVRKMDESLIRELLALKDGACRRITHAIVYTVNQQGQEARRRGGDLNRVLHILQSGLLSVEIRAGRALPPPDGLLFW